MSVAVSRVRRGPIGADETREAATYQQALALFPRLTAEEIDELGRVSVPYPTPVWGDNGTLRKLWRLGLIERDEVLMPFKDGLPPMWVPVWLMPVGYGVHIAWCEWCARCEDAALASRPTDGAAEVTP